MIHCYIWFSIFLIVSQVIQKERRGDYLGKTVQMYVSQVTMPGHPDFPALSESMCQTLGLARCLVYLFAGISPY